MNIEKIKEKIKVTYKLNVKTIKEIFEEANTRLKAIEVASGRELTDKEKEERLNTILSSMLIKRVNSKAEDYEGICFTDTGVKIRNEWQINQVLEKYYRDPLEKEKLLASGEVRIVNDEPIVIDLDEQKWGKENPNYGKPLPQDKYRTIETSIRTKEGTEKFSLRLRGESLNDEVPRMSVINFRATKFIRGENKMLFLEHGTVRIKDEKVDNIKEIIQDIYKDNIIDIADVKKRLLAIKDKKAPRLVVVKGIIDSIDLGKEKPSITLRKKVSLETLAEGGADEVDRLYVKVDRTFDGAPYTEGMVLGNLWETGTEGENPLLGMTANGWLCEQKVVKTEEIKETESEGEEEEW